jgi:hypothetical protein
MVYRINYIRYLPSCIEGVPEEFDYGLFIATPFGYRVPSRALMLEAVS